MAASASSLHLIPQTLSLSISRYSSAAYSFPLFTPSSLKPLPKLTISISSKSFNNVINSYAEHSSKFARKVAVSSELDELEEEVGEGNEGFNFSSPEEPNFSPDLKLFVGNLPFNVDSAALAGLFEQAGNVEMVEVIYDKLTGRSRGFGFVTMSTAEEAAVAAQQFNGYEIEGRPLRVNSGPPPPKREVSKERLWKAKVVYDRESGRSRGFGFVTYSSADEVNNAVQSLDGMDLDGRSIRVSPAEARPRRQF
ncbi:RNA-binding protein CP29B [Abeliophyllum distichum]|uniref:RNA-binding protein CP29B n=1 Tax=Abeliophyllum distichum TaxID=126358 RepID=A0ABD1QYZ0_9LAMI